MPSPFAARGEELRLSNAGQLELLRAIVERGVPLRIKARGFSMEPFIRDGDVLTIVPAGNREVHVGDVVAVELPRLGRLVIHRVVARVNGGWLLRGDNARSADGMISREDILGQVVRVERHGHEVRLGLGVDAAWIAATSRSGALARLRAVYRAWRGVAAAALRSAQGLPQYRAVARRYASGIEIVPAGAADLDEIRRRLRCDVSPELHGEGSAVANWVAKRAGAVIGFVQHRRAPADGSPWAGDWLLSLMVVGRYRGFGAGELLTREVMRHARSCGADELLLAVGEDNGRAIRLYRKLGFERAVVPALEAALVEEGERLGRRRIVMRRSLRRDCRSARGSDEA